MCVVSYLDLCQEKNSLEDTLRTEFEFELKNKLDDVHRILEAEYNEKILLYENNHRGIEQDNQSLEIQYDQHLENQLKELYQEIETNKIKHEKKVTELNNELDRLKANGKFFYFVEVHFKKVNNT